MKINDLCDTILAVFPKAGVSQNPSTFDNTVSLIRFTLVDDRAKLPHRIIDNDPAFTLWSVRQWETHVEISLVRGGRFMVKPAAGNHHLAMDGVKLGWRNKKGTPEQVLKHLNNFLIKARKVIEENVDNAYGNDEQIAIYKEAVS